MLVETLHQGIQLGGGLAQLAVEVFGVHHMSDHHFLDIADTDHSTLLSSSSTLQSSLWESGDFVLVSIQPGCDVSIVGLVSELNLESGKYPICL